MFGKCCSWKSLGEALLRRHVWGRQQKMVYRQMEESFWGGIYSAIDTSRTIHNLPLSGPKFHGASPKA